MCCHTNLWVCEWHETCHADIWSYIHVFMQHCCSAGHAAGFSVSGELSVSWQPLICSLKNIFNYLYMMGNICPSSCMYRASLELIIIWYVGIKRWKLNLIDCSCVQSQNFQNWRRLVTCVNIRWLLIFHISMLSIFYSSFRHSEIETYG